MRHSKIQSRSYQLQRCRSRLFKRRNWMKSIPIMILARNQLQRFRNTTLKLMVMKIKIMRKAGRERKRKLAVSRVQSKNKQSIKLGLLHLEKCRRPKINHKWSKRRKFPSQKCLAKIPKSKRIKRKRICR